MSFTFKKICFDIAANFDKLEKEFQCKPKKAAHEQLCIFGKHQCTLFVQIFFFSKNIYQH